MAHGLVLGLSRLGRQVEVSFTLGCDALRLRACAMIGSARDQQGRTMGLGAIAVNSVGMRGLQDAQQWCSGYSRLQPGVRLAREL